MKTLDNKLLITISFLLQLGFFLFQWVIFLLYFWGKMF